MKSNQKIYLIACAIVCAMLILLAACWQPAGDPVPRPEFPGGEMMEVNEK